MKNIDKKQMEIAKELICQDQLGRTLYDVWVIAYNINTKTHATKMGKPDLLSHILKKLFNEDISDKTIETIHNYLMIK